MDFRPISLLLKCPVLSHCSNHKHFIWISGVLHLHHYPRKVQVIRIIQKLKSYFFVSVLTLTGRVWQTRDLDWLHLDWLKLDWLVAEKHLQFLNGRELKHFLHDILIWQLHNHLWQLTNWVEICTSTNY